MGGRKVVQVVICHFFLFFLGLLNVSSSFVVVLPAFSVGTLWLVITTMRHIHVDLQAML